MTHLASSAKYLGERGIEARLVSQAQLHCSRPSDRTLSLSATVAGYSVSAWDVTPGPGIDDFMLDGLTLDAALLTVWHFFHGMPVVMDGWLISVHRYPDWSLSKLAYCMASACRLELSQFRMLAEKRRDSQAGPSLGEVRSGKLLERYESALRSQYVRCAHAHDPALSLMVRRDLEEACVVRMDEGMTLAGQGGVGNRTLSLDR